MTAPGYLATASRRHLLGGVAALMRPTTEDIANVGTAGPGTAGGVTAGPPFPDGPLVAAASAFCGVERRMLALIEGPGRITDDEARDRVLEPLRDEQMPHLDALCRLEAQTLTGHVARALAFLLWDGGELACRAEAQVSLEDQLLWSLVRDLAAMPC